MLRDDEGVYGWGGCRHHAMASTHMVVMGLVWGMAGVWMRCAGRDMVLSMHADICRYTPLSEHGKATG